MTTPDNFEPDAYDNPQLSYFALRMMTDLSDRDQQTIFDELQRLKAAAASLPPV